MIIRIGSEEELSRLWGIITSPTLKLFQERISKDTQELWVMEEDNTGKLIGELHIIWDSVDKDEANGKNRAYLCAFRIDRDYQGLGYGSKLMKNVLNRIKDKGFSEATIGVEVGANKLELMYKKWGFSEYIKTKDIDHHYVDAQGNPTLAKLWNLYLLRQTK